jgi:hypothetical protein
MSSDIAIENFRAQTNWDEQQRDQSAVRLRSDLIDIYVIRRRDGVFQFLQLQPRPKETAVSAPASGSFWMPVLGRVAKGETAVQAAVRVLSERLGLNVTDANAFGGLWACAPVLPFFFPERDCIVLSPRFVVLAAWNWEPAPDAAQVMHRWKEYSTFTYAYEELRAGFDRQFDTWPGQAVTVNEIMSRFDSDLTRGHSRHPFFAVGL